MILARPRRGMVVSCYQYRIFGGLEGIAPETAASGFRPRSDQRATAKPQGSDRFASRLLRYGGSSRQILKFTELVAEVAIFCDGNAMFLYIQ